MALRAVAREAGARARRAEAREVGAAAPAVEAVAARPATIKAGVPAAVAVVDIARVADSSVVCTTTSIVIMVLRAVRPVDLRVVTTVVGDRAAAAAVDTPAAVAADLRVVPAVAAPVLTAAVTLLSNTHQQLQLIQLQWLQHQRLLLPVKLHHQPVLRTALLPTAC